MPVKDEHKKTLEQHSQGNKFIYSSYDNVTQEMVQEANVIIGNVDPFYLQEAKNLEWLQLNSAGADPYVKKGVLPENVIFFQKLCFFQKHTGSETLILYTFKHKQKDILM